MKRKTMAFVLAIALGITSIQGCIGSFGLTGKLYNFNKSLGNKWVQELGFLVLVIIPVYAITILVDGIVLNSIQFWTGTNPVAMQPGEKEVQYVKGENGLYKIEATRNRFHIAQIDGPNAGESVDLVYKPEADTWFVDNGHGARKVAQFDGKFRQAKVFKPDGKVVTVRTDSTKEEIYMALGVNL